VAKLGAVVPGGSKARATGDDGEAGVKPFRHGRPGLDPGISPGHPIVCGAALFMIGITGTRPVMTPRSS
jgi:hypothetical protein